MQVQKRQLHFDSFDLKQLTISSQCSVCGREFNGEPIRRELFDDLITRIKADYAVHACPDPSSDTSELPC